MKDSTINAGGFSFSTNANTNARDVKIEIENSTLNSLFTSNRDNVGFLINVDADVTVKNSTISGGRQAVIVRSGNVTIQDSTIKYTNEYFNNPTDEEAFKGPYYDETWSSGNRVATAAIVVGDDSVGSYVGSQTLTLKNITYQDVTPKAKVSSDTTATTRKSPYKLFVKGESAMYPASVYLDKKSADQLLSNIRDEVGYYHNQYGNIVVDELDAGITREENVLVEDKFYSNLYKDKDGNIDENLSTLVTNLEGKGTETEPFLVSTTDELEAVERLNIKGDVFVKLNNDTPLLVTNPIVVGKDTNLNLDLNGKSIAYHSTMHKDVHRNHFPYLIEVFGKLNLDDSTKTETEKHGKGSLKGVIGTIRFNEDSRGGTINSGTLTNVNNEYTDTAGIYVACKEKVTINYVRVAGSNYALFGNQYSNIELNDGEFVSLSYYSLGFYNYTVVTNGKMTINGGKVRGIQGGISINGGNGSIINDVDAMTSANETGKAYFSIMKEVNEKPLITEQEFEKDPNKYGYHALYVAGEENKVSATIKGGKFFADNTGYALYVGNSNDGGLGKEASVLIEGGDFATTNQSHQVILVDQKVPSYGYGNLEIQGGTFLLNEKSKSYISAFVNTELCTITDNNTTKRLEVSKK